MEKKTVKVKIRRLKYYVQHKEMKEKRQQASNRRPPRRHHHHHRRRSRRRCRQHTLSPWPLKCTKCSAQHKKSSQPRTKELNIGTETQIRTDADINHVEIKNFMAFFITSIVHRRITFKCLSIILRAPRVG